MLLRKLIERPITVTMISLVIIVLGLVSLRHLPVSLIPELDIPFITVQASSPDLSAREMDESVLKPLRQQLVQINGLEDILCEARDGSGSVQLTFSHGVNIDYLFIEVNEKIDRAMSSLPNIPRPKVIKASASDIPAFFINVTAEGDFGDLSGFTEEVVAKRIEQLKEVAMVDISGTLDNEILILPDETAIRRLGMTMDELEACIRGANVRLGNLTIRDGEYRYNVRFDSRIGSVEDISNLWFIRGGRLMQIKDIANVSLVPAKRIGLVKSDGTDAVCLAIIKQSDARMSDLRKSMDKLLEAFSLDYPQIKFTVTRDQTRLLEFSIKNLLQSIFVALLICCAVIFLFMRDIKSTALVAMSMPVALIFSILCFKLLGISINIISLSGFLLGVGMMTDNAIILVDNITGRWQRGDNLREAVLEGTSDVMGPMLSSVLTTCAVFIPLVFIKGLAGAVFKDQALSITIVLLTSYLVTISLIPVYYWWWYGRKQIFTPRKTLERIKLTELLLKWDDRWLKFSIRHRYVSWIVLILSSAGMVTLFTIMPKERLPQISQTDAILKIDWNEHLSIEQNSERIGYLGNMISRHTKQITAFVGTQNFILGHSAYQGMSEVSLYFECSSTNELDEVQKLLTKQIDSKYPDASFSFNSSGNIFDMVFASSESPLTARLRPLKASRVELGSLRHLISEINDSLPEISIANPAVKADVVFIADPELMALHGISYSQMVSVLKNALNENRIFSIVQGTHSIPVVTGSNSGSLSEIMQKTFFENKDSKGNISRIPASSLMKQYFMEDLRTIVSGGEGSYYPLDMNISYKDVKRVMDVQRAIIKDDGNYDVTFSGSWFTNRKMSGRMIVILLISLILLYLILASQFESLVQPLIILSEIVIDIFVSLLVLLLCGVSINLMSMIGLVVISGIVINDSILKLDTINRMRRLGVGLKKAVLMSSSRRVKAIVMTSLTTILAVCPFLSRGSMGADFQYPMSLVIIAGMIAGTLVSLFIVPSLYYSIYDRKGE